MKDTNIKYQISNIKYLILLFLIVIVHVFALSKLLFFPYPELFVYPYLANHGLLPYKQIFDQHFPGLLFLPLNFEVLGLTNEYIARFWQYGLLIMTQVLLFFVSAKLFKNYFKALAVCFLYLLWQPFFQGWVLWINNFLTIFYLLAFYFAVRSLKENKNGYDVFLTGFILAVATVFKQVAIPLAGLVFLYLLYWKRSFQTIKNYCFGFLIPIIGMLGYLASIGVLKDFWFWTVQFNLTTYATLGGSVPEAVSVKRIVGVSLPTILSLFDQDKKYIYLVIVFFTGSFLAGGNNFDFTYFQPALPYVCIATIYGFNWLIKKKIGWLMIGIYFIVCLRWLMPFYQSHTQEYVYYFDADTKSAAISVKQLTRPGEEIFVYGVTPLMYQMTETLPAGKVFVYQFPWFLADAGERIYHGLIESKPRIIVSDPTVQTKGRKITDFAPQLYNYIYAHYQLKAKIGTIEILERKD